jgi:transmembrane sensor
VRTADGSTITLEGRESEATVREQSSEQVTVSLERGRGRFAVTPNPGRHFDVKAANVTVTVVGTEFVVERRDDHTWVHVTKGTVRISWPGGEDLLHAAGEGSYPPIGLENHPTAAADNVQPDEPNAPSAAPSQATDEGPSKHPVTSTSRSAGSSGSRPAAALLREADAARIAGHDEEAIRLLRRVMSDYPDDPQARMAAFVLGRILAAKGRSSEAMDAFSAARRPGQGDGLGEDALARQVEVADESGDHATAHRLAEEFLRAYPKSSRVAQIKRLGDLR